MMGAKPGSAQVGDRLMALVTGQTQEMLKLLGFVVLFCKGPLMNVGDVKVVEELIYCVQFDMT